MTYILGWKTGGATYLAADSAITENRLVDEGFSSFGERAVAEPGRSVYEGCLKVFNLGKVAVAGAGDLVRVRSLVERIKRSLDLGSDPRKAFQTAINSNAPFTPSTRAQVLLTFPDVPAPRLLSFDSTVGMQLVEHSQDQLVQFGSIAPAYKSLTGQMLRYLRQCGLVGIPEAFLAAVVGFLQSFGIRGWILDQHAGGAFCGLFVGGTSIEWQKDILFCLHDGLSDRFDMVSSIVRDSVLVVRSNITHSCRYFADSLSSGPFDDWKRTWWDPAFEVTPHGRFDYIVLLNLQHWIVTLIQMHGHRYSKHLRIEGAPGQSADEGFRLNVALSPVLSEAIRQPTPDRGNGTRPFKFNWFPYENPE